MNHKRASIRFTPAAMSPRIPLILLLIIFGECLHARSRYMFLLQAANAHICLTVTCTVCVQCPWVLCNLSASAGKPGKQCNRCQGRWLLHLVCALVCEFLSFFYAWKCLKLRKIRPPVACCRLSTIKCQHCKAEAGVMRPICHRLKRLYVFEAFSYLNVQYCFNAERQKSSFFPDLGATATSHLRTTTCILLSQASCIDR